MLPISAVPLLFFATMTIFEFLVILFLLDRIEKLKEKLDKAAEAAAKLKEVTKILIPERRGRKK